MMDDQGRQYLCFFCQYTDSKQAVAQPMGTLLPEVAKPHFNVSVPE
jgi:hypothetical protein